MTQLEPRSWVPAHVDARVRQVAGATARRTAVQNLAELDRLVRENHQIHDRDCINLNPATNIMNPRAEAMLSAGLGSRPSLGYPGDKYEMGLEAIEQIEVQAAELAAEVFAARHAEILTSTNVKRPQRQVGVDPVRWTSVKRPGRPRCAAALEGYRAYLAEGAVAPPAVEDALDP